jgi:hypothetical protein
MNLFSWFKKKAFGEELLDFGALPSDLHGWRVSASLRQIRDQPPYLLLRWEHGGNNRVFTSLACTPDVYAKLDGIIGEVRRRIGN